MKRIFITFIILLFPLCALAHGDPVHLDANPGILPGGWEYPFEQIGEWIEINIFTLSTKRKQEKKLALASERLAEFEALFTSQNAKPKALRQALSRYQHFLREARDMVEKIIILDGAELPLAEKFERTSRLHEQVLAELLEGASSLGQGILQEALITARLENEDAFKFMVKNYQFNEADIEKHQKILDEHLEIIEARLTKDHPKYKQVAALLDEARKFQTAGLNIEAYDLVNRAKNLVY